MADIRPPGSAALPTPAARPANPARTAAQRAFFQAAVGQTQAAGVPTATPTAAQAPAPQAQTQPLRQAPSTEAPTRYLRPGSLIDIKV